MSIPHRSLARERAQLIASGCTSSAVAGRCSPTSRWPSTAGPAWGSSERTVAGGRRCCRCCPGRWLSSSTPTARSAGLIDVELAQVSAAFCRPLRSQRRVGRWVRGRGGRLRRRARGRVGAGTASVHKSPDGRLRGSADGAEAAHNRPATTPADAQVVISGRATGLWTSRPAPQGFVVLDGDAWPPASGGGGARFRVSALGGLRRVAPRWAAFTAGPGRSPAA
jgi:hypothetical protein